ncbi:MAG TPA: hypothetical protein PLG77_12255 [Burkholderiaceae bacterium]|nr:hypothetical protein [Burkholderiaceae bacterium]HRP29192.1 hypothetical protein [Burkholderiaceae bacterium]
MKDKFSRPPFAVRAFSLLAAALVVALLFWVQFGLAEHYDSVGVTALVGPGPAPVTRVATASAPRP